MKLGKRFFVLGLLAASTQVWSGTMGEIRGNKTTPGFGVGGQLLILQADFPSLAYIGSTSTISAKEFHEDFHAKTFSFGPGFMVEAFYNTRENRDINLNWYHYAWGTTQALPSGINVYDSRFYGNVSLKLNPHWNAVNLEFGVREKKYSNDTLRLHGGIQYAEMALDNDTTATDTSILGSAVQRINKSSYSGTGIRGGGDYAYSIGHGFSANFNGAIALLYGTHRFERLYYIATSGTPALNANSGNSTSIITELEGKLGGSYTYMSHKNYFMIDAGWMLINYYNPIEVADSFHNGRTKESNFALSGPYVGLRWMGFGL